MIKHFSSLRSRLMLLVSAIIAALFLLELLTQGFWFNTRYRSELQNNLQVARAIGLAFEGLVRDVLHEEFAIGTARRVLRPETAEELQEYLDQVAESYSAVRDFLIADSSGTITYSSNPQSIGLRVADRTYFKQLIAGDTTVVSDFLKTRDEGIEGFVIATGFFTPAGNLDFAVLATVEAAKIDEVLNLPRQRGTYFTLFDKQGTLIYSDQQFDTLTEADRQWKNHDPLMQQALEGDETTGFFTTPIGADRRRIGARVPISTIGWVAGSATTVYAFFLPFVIPFTTVLSISIIVALATLLIAKRFVGTITHSLDTVQHHVRRVAQGEFVPIKATSGLTEFDALINDTNSMAQQLQNRERDLKLSEERFRGAIDNLLDAFTIMNPIRDKQGRLVDYRFEYANHVALEMAGLRAEKFIGHLASELFPPETQSGVLPLYDRVLLTGQPTSIDAYYIAAPRGTYKQGLYIDIRASNLDGKIALAWRDVTSRVLSEKYLRESEQRFRQLANSMPQLVWTAEPDGTVDYYNERHRDFGGIAPTIEGHWQWGPVLHEEDLQPTEDAWKHAVATGETYQIEHRVKHADGSFHWYLSRGIPARNENGVIVKWYGTATNIDIIKQAQADLAESENRLRVLNENLESLVVKRTEQVRALSKALTMAEQRERRRFSQILHEDLQQVLFGAKMQIDLVSMDLESRPTDSEIDMGVQEGTRLINKALGITKTLALELNPPILNTQGLDSALQWLISFMQQNQHLTVHMNTDSKIQEIRNETQIMAVQIVRELLNNVTQHSGVSEATLLAECNPGFLRIVVHDDGKGFDVEKTRSEFGSENKLGLFSIEERLKLFGGQLMIESAPGKGTTCTATIPSEKC